MKQDYLVLIVFLLFTFLLCSYPISAGRLPPQNKGTEKGYMKLNEIVHQQDGSLASTIKEDDFLNIMGLESDSESDECSEKDEECVTRRIIAEAHLDYVYTQKHKNP